MGDTWHTWGPHADLVHMGSTCRPDAHGVHMQATATGYMLDIGHWVFTLNSSVKTM